MFFKYGGFKKGRKVHLNVEVMMSYIKNIFESREYLIGVIQIFRLEGNIHSQFKNIYVISLKFSAYQFSVYDGIS